MSKKSKRKDIEARLDAVTSIIKTCALWLVMPTLLAALLGASPWVPVGAVSATVALATVVAIGAPLTRGGGGGGAAA